MQSIKLAILSLASFASVAAADPAKPAQREMYWALRACQDGLASNASAGDRAAALERYQVSRAKAVAADPAIVTWHGKAQGMLGPVDEAVSRCDRELPALVGKATGARDADALAEQAIRACDTPREPHPRGVESANQRLAEYTTKRDAARQRDPEVTKRAVLGVNVGAKFAECDKKLPEQVTAAKQERDDEQRAHADRARRGAAEESARAAAEARRAAELRKTLAGDKRKVFDAEGEPGHYNADTLGASSQWIYRSVSGDLACEITYRFSGNKLARKSKSGPGCR